MNKLFSLDVELVNKLKGEKNASALINSLLSDYYNISPIDKLKQEVKNNDKLKEKLKVLEEKTEIENQLKIKEEIENEEPETAKLEKNIDSKTKIVMMWSGLCQEDARKVAIEYLNLPGQTRPESLKQFLINIGIPSIDNKYREAFNKNKEKVSNSTVTTDIVS